VVEAELRVRPCERLALCGHSLGGALAMTLLGAGLLPCASGDAAAEDAPAEVLAFTYGSPACFHGQLRGATMRRVRAQSFVYGADAVPRLLGSEVPLLRAAALSLGGKSSTGALEILGGYAHWPGGEVVYLDPAGGCARRVPRAQRDRLLHLHRAVHPDAAAHHKCYVRGLERAAALGGGLAWWQMVLGERGEI